MLELCLIIIVVIGIHAERLLHNGSIEGRVSPAVASPSIIAVREMIPCVSGSNDGRFGMELQPGDWKLIFAVKEFNGFPLKRRCRYWKVNGSIWGIRLTE
jgi:hypothetical protein